MAKFTAITLLALSLGLLGTVYAQNLDMSGSEGSITFDQPGKPTRGMSQESVQANFGAPAGQTDTWHVAGKRPGKFWRPAVNHRRSRRSTDFTLGICRVCSLLRVQPGDSLGDETLDRELIQYEKTRSLAARFFVPGQNGTGSIFR
jgi:hypothetical protein